MGVKSLKEYTFEELDALVIDWSKRNKDIVEDDLDHLYMYNQETVARHVSEYRKYHLSKISEGFKRNVLVISDTHIPHVHKDALEALKKAYIKYDITDVIHIGDVTDAHTVSYHETSNKASGVNQELETTKEALKEWYKAFPEVTVLNSNHDGLIKRKAQTAKIPDAAIVPLNEMLGVPDWSFVDFYQIGKVQFNHGLGGTAKNRAKQMGMSVVQGHLHGQKYIEYVDHNHNTFAFQLGCLIDKDSYAMEYGKFHVAAIGFGVIMDIEGDCIPISLTC